MKFNRRISTIGLLVLAGCALTTGCSCRTKTETPNVNGTNADDSDKPSVFVPEPLPEVVASPDEIRAQMKPMKPFSPDFEKKKIELLVAWEKIRKREGIEGFQESENKIDFAQMAHLDPHSGKMAWPAYTCFNPACTGKGKGGGPFLFVIELSHVKIGPGGKIVEGMPDLSDSRPYTCPACGSHEFVRPYELPETIVRQKALTLELHSAYNSIRAAQANGQSPPNGVRLPIQVMTSVAKLPRLFIVPEAGKVAGFDRLTAPASAGRTSGAK